MNGVVLRNNKIMGCSQNSVCFLNGTFKLGGSNVCVLL